MLIDRHIDQGDQGVRCSPTVLHTKSITIVTIVLVITLRVYRAIAPDRPSVRRLFAHRFLAG